MHIVCHQCGSVTDAEPEIATPLAAALQTEQGFELDIAHFTVFGRCADCREQTGTGQR